MAGDVTRVKCYIFQIVRHFRNFLRGFVVFIISQVSWLRVYFVFLYFVI